MRASRITPWWNRLQFLRELLVWRLVDGRSTRCRPRHTRLAVTPLEDRYLPSSVWIASAPASIPEGGWGGITLGRAFADGPLSVAIQVQTPAGYDSSTAGSDYVLQGTAEFSSGSTSAYVSLSAPIDNLIEPGNRAIEISINDIPMPSGGSGGSWSGGGGGALSAIIALPDNPPTVWIEWDTSGSGGSGGSGTSGGLVATEGSGVGLTVRRHGGDLGQPLTVALKVTPNGPNATTTWLDDFTVGYGGTPVDGGDGSWYIPITINQAYYSDGTSQSVWLNALADNFVEGDGTVTLAVVAPASAGGLTGLSDYLT
ncbi:MAG: hypothetical protein LC104_09110, partial [Bacteroidales bacterium]|nr:hypothetical protein [Bacteroidales bacterium]